MEQTTASGNSATTLSTIPPQTTIHNGGADVATRCDGLQMRVDVNGRRTFQTAHIWTTVNLASGDFGGIKQYSVERYGPNTPTWQDAPLLPEGNDSVDYGNSETALCLEVGIVDGGDIHVMRETETGSSRDKALEARKKTDVLERPRKALRVFRRITNKPDPQVRYWVGCSRQGGRFSPKTIAKDLVFFYQEFWNAAPKGFGKKNREQAISQSIIHMAVRSTQPESEPTDELSGAHTKSTTSNSSAVAEAEDFCSRLSLLVSTAVSTGETNDFQAACSWIEGAQPSLKDGPKKANEGLTAWFYYDEELSQDEAESVSRELKEAHENMPLIEPGFILAMHKCLRKNPDMAEQKIPRALLPFFLDHSQIKLGPDPDEEEIESKLAALLSDLEVHGRHLRA